MHRKWTSFDGGWSTTHLTESAPTIKLAVAYFVGRDSVVGIATTLRVGLSRDRIPVVARFSASVQTGPGAHPASYTMGTGSLSRG
jgi:hypothetical protein